MCDYKTEPRHLTWSIWNLPVEETTPHLGNYEGTSSGFLFCASSSGGFGSGSGRAALSWDAPRHTAPWDERRLQTHRAPAAGQQAAPLHDAALPDHADRGPG